MLNKYLHWILDIKNALVENCKQKKQKYISETILACFITASLIGVPSAPQCNTKGRALDATTVKNVGLCMYLFIFNDLLVCHH